MKAEGAWAGFFDLHMHTRYSDGKDTPEEMILAAAEQGMTSAGISDHSHTEGDECGMTPEGTIAFRAEMDQLKRKYAGKIRVLCGLERDYYSDDGLDYDYVIGSVHFLRMGEWFMWTGPQRSSGRAYAGISTATGMPSLKPITSWSAGWWKSRNVI